MVNDPFFGMGKEAGAGAGCPHHPPIVRPCESPTEAAWWWECFQKCRSEARHEHLRWLAKNDLYFLAVKILGIPRIETAWHHERCGEVDRNCDGIIDLWTREAGKSAIKTFAKVIKEILNNPEICICIMSHTRPLAKDFLMKLKNTFEGHELLRSLFPEILWDNPKVQAPSWSLDHGITLKRQSVTRGERTLEASGLTEGQLTGKHFDVLVYDDVQAGRESMEMVAKIEGEFDTSQGLGIKPNRNWMNGVFFRGPCVYENLIERKVVLARIRPALKPDMSSPIWNDEQVRSIRVRPDTLACEYLMDPTIKAEGEGFKEEWLAYHNGLSAEELQGCNLYILVDPGRGRQNNARSGKTVHWVVALRPDKKIYIIDGVMAGMSLTQRIDWTLAFHRQYSVTGRLVAIGYEQFNLQSDIESIKIRCEKDGYPMPRIVALSNPIPKDTRIEWLIEPWSKGVFLLPKSIPKRVINGEEIDMLKTFLDLEWRKWPATKNMDGLDSLAWIMYKHDVNDKDGETPKRWMPVFPEGYDDPSVKRKQMDWQTTDGRAGSWMTE